MTNRIETRVSALAAIAERLGRNVPSNRTARLAIQQEVVRLHAATDGLAGLVANADPTMTAAAHTKRVMAAANRLLEQTRASRDRLHRIVQEGSRDVERRISEKVKLTPDGYAAEIRATFRTLTPARQHEVLRELAVANRGPELAALIACPSLLTGLTDENRARYRELIVTTHAPDEHQEGLELIEAFTTALDILPTAEGAAHDHMDPAALAYIERAEEAAARASVAFAQAMEA